MRTTVPKSAVRTCAHEFLRPLLELIRPRAVVSLGVQATSAVLQGFCLSTALDFQALIREPTGLALPGGGRLFPVPHPAASKALAEHDASWRRIGAHVAGRAMVRLLLDTDIYTDLANEPEIRGTLAGVLSAGTVEVIVTPKVRDQLRRGPFGGVPDWFPITILPESVFVLGHGRLDQARLGEGDVYGQHRGESSSRGNIEDAIIADSGAEYADIVVSGDRRLRHRLSALAACSVQSFEEFCTWLHELAAQ
jgi:hypothetical protein